MKEYYLDHLEQTRQTQRLRRITKALGSDSHIVVRFSNNDELIIIDNETIVTNNALAKQKNSTKLFKYKEQLKMKNDESHQHVSMRAVYSLQHARPNRNKHLYCFLFCQQIIKSKVKASLWFLYSNNQLLKKNICITY